MDAYIYLIPVTILIVTVMLLALIYSITSSQDEDLDKEGNKILFIDEKNK